jgi:hypothetical protein
MLTLVYAPGSTGRSEVSAGMQSIRGAAPLFIAHQSSPPGGDVRARTCEGVPALGTVGPPLAHSDLASAPCSDNCAPNHRCSAVNKWRSVVSNVISAPEGRAA